VPATRTTLKKQNKKQTNNNPTKQQPVRQFGLYIFIDISLYITSTPIQKEAAVTENCKTLKKKKRNKKGRKKYLKDIYN